MASSEPAGCLISVEHQPDDFLIVACVTGADAMMDCFPGPGGVLLTEDKCQSLSNDR
jgi:hypothetical protein